MGGIGAKTDWARRRREELFLAQKGRCNWCGVEMTPTLGPRRAGDPPTPPTMLTLDHVFDRLDPRRYQNLSMAPHVAACFECNQRRAKTTSAKAVNRAPVVGEHKGPADVSR